MNNQIVVSVTAQGNSIDINLDPKTMTSAVEYLHKLNFKIHKDPVLPNNLNLEIPKERKQERYAIAESIATTLQLMGYEVKLMHPDTAFHY